MEVEVVSNPASWMCRVHVVLSICGSRDRQNCKQLSMRWPKRPLVFRYLWVSADQKPAHGQLVLWSLNVRAHIISSAELASFSVQDRQPDMVLACQARNRVSAWVPHKKSGLTLDLGCCSFVCPHLPCAFGPDLARAC